MAMYQRFSDKMAYIRGKFVDLPSRPRFVSMSFTLMELKGSLKALSKKLSWKATKAFSVILGNPINNFCTEYNVDGEGVYHCSFSLKDFKRVRNYSRRKYFSVAVAAVTVIAVIFSVIFPGKPLGLAAARESWSQTSWSGLPGPGPDTASHALNRNGWTKYSAKTASVAGTDANIGLNVTNDAWTQGGWSTATPANLTDCTAAGGTWISGVCYAMAPGNKDNWNSYSSKTVSIKIDDTDGANKLLRMAPQTQGDSYMARTAGGNEGIINIGATGTQTTVAQAWTNGASGKYGGSLNFDGTDDALGVNADLNLTTAATISAWVKTPGKGAWQAVVDYGQNPYTASIYINSLGQPRCQFDTTTQSVASITDTTSNLNNGSVWNFIACVYDGSNIKIYVNGEYKNQTPYSGILDNNLKQIGIGQRGTYNGYNFQGSIDDVRIFNKALEGPDYANGKTCTDSSESEKEICKVKDGEAVYDHLVSHWTFDEGSGNVAGDSAVVKRNNGTLNIGPNGTQTSASTAWTTGTTDIPSNGGALSLDGNDDYVDLGSVLTLDGATQLTVSFWVKPNSLPFSGYQGIFARGTTGQRTPWIFGNSAGSTISAQFETTIGGNNDCNVASANLTQGVWNHLALVWNGSFCVFYLGGTSGTSNPGTSDTTNSTQGNALVNTDGTNFIGYINGYAKLNGSVDDIQIYNTALDATQINTVKSGGTVSTGLISHWKFDDASGTTAYDSAAEESGNPTIFTNFSGTGNVKDHVAITGSTDSGSLQFCDYDHGGADWTPTDNDGIYDLNGATAGIEVAGVHCNVKNFTVASNTVVKAYDSGTGKYGRFVLYAQNATINTGVSLSADGMGYAGGVYENGVINTPAAGSGAGLFGGQGGAGAGYGGVGGIGYGVSPGGVSYGSVSNPNDLGSGGGSGGWYTTRLYGGSGGGIIRLNISGTLTNNGTISAKGGNGTGAGTGTGGAAAGGSGGSIYLNAGTIAGTAGTISVVGGNGGAHGGSYDGGGGGGGRVAVYYLGTFPAGISINANGGTADTGGQYGGAGTIYKKASGNGDLIVKNNSVTGATTPIDTITLDNLTISNNAILAINSSKTVTTAAGGTFTLDTSGTFTTVNTALTVNGTLDLKAGAGTLSVNASTKKLTFGSTGNLIIRTGATLTHDANSTVAATPYNTIDWTLTNVTIENGGAINVDGKGFSGDNGPGAGSQGNLVSCGGGGGYGGIGGNCRSFGFGPVNSYNGSSCIAGGVSKTNPSCLGSGGGYVGTAGGGMVKIATSSNGQVTIAGGGSISANGGPQTNTTVCIGAGSGGSVNISTGTLTIAGSISANGGNITHLNTARYGGAGGGGRIAISYAISKNITGTVSVLAGTGGNAYGDGAPQAGTKWDATAGADLAYVSDGKSRFASREENDLRLTNYDSGMGDNGTCSMFELDGDEEGVEWFSTSDYLRSNSNVGQYPVSSIQYQVYSRSNYKPQITNKAQITNHKLQINTKYQISDKTNNSRSTIEIIRDTIYDIRNTISNVFALAFGVPAASAATGLATTGTYESPVFDAGGSTTYSQLSWTANVPADGASVSFSVATSNCPNGQTDANCTAGTWTYTDVGSTSPASLSAVGQSVRYSRYKITFSRGANKENVTTVGAAVADFTVSDVTLKYSLNGYDTAVHTLTSTPYKADTGNNDNRITSLSWVESSHKNVDGQIVGSPGANSYVKMQIKTAPNNTNGTPNDFTDDIPGVWGNLTGPDGTSNTYFGYSNAQDSSITLNSCTKTGNNVTCPIPENLSIANGTDDQWIRYEVSFKSNGSETAVIDNISLGYRNNLTGNFTSSAYDTGQPYTVPAQLVWDEAVPGASSIYFRLATSADNSTWTGFVGPDNTANTQYESANSNCSKTGITVTCNIPQGPTLSFSDGYFDQWIKYQAWFVSDGAAIPLITSVTFNYDQNTAPSIAAATFSAQQLTSGSDIGKISINYDLADAEQSDNINVSALVDLGITLMEAPGASLDPGDSNGDGIKDIYVSDASLLPDPSLPSSTCYPACTIQIGNEQITYTAKVGNYLTVNTVTGVRAANQTKYESHQVGDAVWLKGTTVSGAVGNQSTGINKNILWNLAADLPSAGAYLASAKIRVTANDRQTGNPTGTRDSAAFPVDARKPQYAVSAVKINANNIPELVLGISADASTGSHATYMRFSATDLTNTPCTSASPAWQPYQTTYSFSNILTNFLFTPTPGANGVYTIYWQFKDDYCNLISGVASTPQRTSGVQLGDISIPPTGQYKLLVWWNPIADPVNGDIENTFIKYHAWRAIDDPNSDYADITDTLVSRAASLGNCAVNKTDASCNYFIDNILNNDGTGTWLNPASSYYYKITAESVKGTSAFGVPQGGSAQYPVVDGIPNGGTGGETGAIPVISYDPPSGLSKDSSSATFTWQATTTDNKPSDSFILYTPEAEYASNYLYSQGIPSLINSGLDHTATLHGLASGVTYHYQVKSCGVQGNCGTTATDYTFTTDRDTTAPIDTSLASSNITPSSVTITWTVPGDDNAVGTASSYDLRYSTNASVRDNKAAFEAYWDNPATVQVSDEPKPIAAGAGITQSLTIANLTPGTTYYFALKTTDDANLTSPISNVLQVDIPTQADTTPPVIATGPADALSLTAPSTSATITWTTNEASSSLVDYGSCNTLDYGSTQGNSAIIPPGTSHEVVLIGLAPNTQYCYRAKSLDEKGNVGQKPLDTDPILTKAAYNFTTAAAPVNGTLPNIQSIAKTEVSPTSWTISWTTLNIASDSTVYYGQDGSASPYPLVAGSAAAVSSHSVTLTGLTPAKTYNFIVKSRDKDQEAASANQTLTTSAGADTIPPIYTSGPAVSGITGSAATITWSTSESSASYVDFGTAVNAYTSIQGSSTDALAHSVQLTSLAANTTYYFQVRSIDASNNETIANNSGSGYTFTTTSGSAVQCPAQGGGGGSICQVCSTCAVIDTTAPVITEVAVSEVTFNSATITWNTDEKSDSRVKYRQETGVYEKAEFNENLTQSHSVFLANLDPSTVYYFRVSSADSKGNIAESSELSLKTLAISDITDKDKKATEQMKKEFEDLAKTLIKENITSEEDIKEIISRLKEPPLIGGEGPEIKNIKSYGATITWTTDRRTNSIVKFKATSESPGVVAVDSTWEQRGKIDEFDIIHEIDLLGLTPSTHYSFQVESQDVLGNSSVSPIKEFTTAAASSIFAVRVTDITLNSAVINWETSNPSSSLIEYGFTPIYGQTKDKGAESAIVHSIPLADLLQGTTYHFRARSVEASGQILASDDYSFTTYQMPEVTKYALGEVKDNSIEIKWLSNIPINSAIRYTNKETKEAKIEGKPDLLTDHALTLTDLEPGKAYLIEIQGQDKNGNQAVLAPFEVQTGLDTVSPEISQVRSQAAILSGSEERVQAIVSWRTNELASTQLFWDIGSTKGDKFANETKTDENLTTNHILVITQFKPGTVYRFRAVSTDKFGNKAISQDFSILTPVKKQSVIQMIMVKFEDIFGWMNRLRR